MEYAKISDSINTGTYILLKNINLSYMAFDVIINNYALKRIACIYFIGN